MEQFNLAAYLDQVKAIAPEKSRYFAALEQANWSDETTQHYKAAGLTDDEIKAIKWTNKSLSKGLPTDSHEIIALYHQRFNNK